MNGQQLIRNYARELIYLKIIIDTSILYILIMQIISNYEAININN